MYCTLMRVREIAEAVALKTPGLFEVVGVLPGEAHCGYVEIIVIHHDLAAASRLLLFGVDHALSDARLRAHISTRLRGMSLQQLVN